MAVFDVVGGAEPGNDREEDHDTRHNLKYTRSCHDPGSVTMNGIISMMLVSYLIIPYSI